MRSLASALKDFGAPQFAVTEPSAPSDVHSDFDFGAPQMPAFPDVMAAEPVDVDALVAEAVAQAETALTERVTEEHAEALRIERERHAQEVTELQARFAAEAADKIQAGITDMENRVVDLTSAVTARILGVVLTDDLRERSTVSRISFVTR